MDAANGKMSLKIWYKLQWQDGRLAWDPDLYGNVTTVYYQGKNFVGDGSEIWVPDISPYNGYVGLHDTLEPQYARVSSSGLVYFSRPGTVEVMCKFSGLVAFPFDKLTCQLEFGGWLLSGGHQGIQFLGDGFEF